jgi:hypothetical protein
MQTKNFFWNVNKQFVSDILNFEFEIIINDVSYKNDECPSLELNNEEQLLKLWLPSDYKNEHSNYYLVKYDNSENFEISEEFTFTNLAEVIEKLKQYF